MNLNIFLFVLMCCFCISSSAQKTQFENFTKKFSPKPQKTQNSPQVLTELEEEKLKRGKNKVNREDLVIPPQGFHEQKKKLPVPQLSGAVVPNAQLTRATKLDVFSKETKSTEEQITELEQSIDRISNSNDPQRELRISKLEKLLVKKKLEKFNQDQKE